MEIDSVTLSTMSEARSMEGSYMGSGSEEISSFSAPGAEVGR